MKNFTQKFIGLLTLVFTMSFSVNSQEIGDIYEGGIVFQINEDGTGLVSALEDLTEGATDPYGLGFNGYEWGCYGWGVNGADGTSIGTGYQNTIDMVNQGCSTDHGGITAAQAALDAEINGYSDWHLPSKDELVEMYNTIGNGGLEGNIGGFETGDSPYYWSSSEAANYSAWGVYFSNGSSTNGSKSYPSRVRVIRSVSFENEVLGCTDQSAFNYNDEATEDDGSCVAVVNGCMDSSMSNYNSEANTEDSSCVSWEELANSLQSELDNVVIEDGVSQEDVDAAYVAGAASITPEDGVSQADVDAAYIAGAASVTPEDGIGQADVDAAYIAGAASVTPEDGIGQADVDAAYDAGAASVTPEDGIGQADVDAAFDDGVASVEVPECEEVATQNIPLDLPQGWSMFGYTCLESLDVVEAFSGVSDNIEIVKDEWGLAYLPSYGFSAFDNLAFGEGYQIKMIEEVTDFQFCEAIVPEDGITQANVDAAFDEGAASVTPEDGVSQSDLDAVHAMYEGWCASDIDNDGICDVDEVSGCMDASSCNYVSAAEFDDSSCDYVSCLDDCGVINGDNSTCLDCAGVVNGTSEDLGCGCGNPQAQEGYDCDGNSLQVLEIGDLAEGGIVFYIDETGQHGLVAAMEDITEGSNMADWGTPEGFEWGCYGSTVSGADGLSIGTGYQNTLDIVAQNCQTQNGGITAAQATLNYESEGYTDWYLPSIDELYEMYNTIGTAGPAGTIEGFEMSDFPYYRSSSEFNNNFAWNVYFDSGAVSFMNKNYSLRVRAVRAF